MKKNKEIPKKNYIICALIFLFVIAVSLIIYIAYDNHKKYELKTPVLRGKVLEIDNEIVDEYLKENSSVLLFISSSSSEESRELENKMIDVIDKNKSKIAYLNIIDIKDKEEFYKDFNKKYSQDKKLKDYPALLYISDNKIVDLVQDKDNKLTIEDIENFIKIYNISGDIND